MQDISGFGTGVTVVSLSTFPAGFQLSKFADDQDPIKVEDVEVIGYETLIDGSLFTFTKAAVALISVSVIAGSDDDINMKILLQTSKGSAANAVSAGGLSFDTSLVINYPNTGMVMFTNGSIVKGPPADTVQAAGRMRGNTYTFAFGSFTGAQSIGQVIAGAASAILGAL